MSAPEELYEFYAQRISEDAHAGKITDRDFFTRYNVLIHVRDLLTEVDNEPDSEMFSSRDSPLRMHWRINDQFLRVLAQAYDRHPDYREEWRPFP